MVLAQTGLCFLVLPQNKHVINNPTSFFLNVQYDANKPLNKIRGKDQHVNENQQDSEDEDDLVNVFFHQIRNKNSSMTLRKRYWLSMHNTVKSENCCGVTSAKRVAVFQASLKLVGDDGAKGRLQQMTTNAWHSKDQNAYEKEVTVNKNDTLI